MNSLTISELAIATKGKLVIGNESDTINDIVIDSRKANKDNVFVAVIGENLDGHQFMQSAYENGCKTFIKNASSSIKLNSSDINLIEVKDTQIALGDIAKYYKEKFDIPYIGVTGSVGKTSTKDIIASVVSQKYKTLKTEGNNNNNIGLPLTILKLKDHEALVVEMGMNHFGEISLLTNIAKPTLAVITNIGTSHIGNLGSRENILKAKLEILEGMKIPRVIINNDNDLLHKWYEENKEKIEIHTYGINNSSDVIAEKIELGEEKSKFVVKTSSEKVNIGVPVGGEHFVYNALCGFIVGKVLGLTAKEIQNGISKFELTKKRMDIRVLKNGATLINDSYNASYESMKASLKYLSSRTDLRKIAVLGDMLELGDFSKELHEKVGEEVANDNIDVLICRGEFAKNIISKANKNKKTQCILLQNNEEILSKLQEILKEGDGVLIKASNGMKFYEICQKL